MARCKVRFIFHGCIALVPRRDGKAWYLLIGDFPQVPCIPSLVPYVRFPRWSWSETTNKRTLGHPSEDVPPEFAVFRHIRLCGEYLSLCASVPDEDRVLRINDAVDDIITTPTGRTRRSIIWLPELEQITPGAGAINLGLLQVPPVGDPGLAARMDLTGGLLETTGVGREIVEFRSASGRTHKQPIAREVQLTIHVLEDQFMLRSHPINGTPHNPMLDMTFRCDPDRTLEIVIGNEPLDDIYRPMPPTLPPEEVELDTRHEFGRYYTLSANQPVRDPAFPVVGGLRGGGSYCMEPRYSPVGSG